MKGRIHHLMLNVNRYHEAERFYAWRLPKIGYPNQTNMPKTLPSGGADGTTTPAPFGCRRRSHVFAPVSSIASRGTLRNRFRRRQSPPGG